MATSLVLGIEGPALLAGPPHHGPDGLRRYRQHGGYEALRRALQRSPEAVLAEVEAAGLRGRGGAAFPTGRKWAAARAGAPPRYLVCNGGEDEPGSSKDRCLMEHYPHRLLEGMAIAAYAVGAARAYLYVNETFAAALASLGRAVADAYAAGYLGSDIAGSRFSLTVEIVPAPADYVAGEETAALEVIEGRLPRPRRKPPYPTEAGLFGRPTVVNNVETLAAVPGIVRHGAAWFRALGRTEPGTLLVTLSGWVERPGVYEVPLGTPLRAIIEHWGGGARGGKPIKAVLPGGPSTSYLPATALDLPFDYEALRAAGSGVGCGAIRVVPEGVCMVEELQRLALFFAAGSCGQCGPCVQGTRKVAQLAGAIRLGTPDERAVELLGRLGARMPGKGICGLITGAAAPAASALRHFEEDFRYHARYGVCPQLGRPAALGPRRLGWGQTDTPGLRPRGRPGGWRRSRWG